MVDAVYLKSDTVIKGRLVSLTPNQTVSIIDLKDSLHVYNMSDVVKIRKELAEYHPNDLSDKSYFSVGGTMGYPCILNFRFGYHTNSHFFALSGNYLGLINGVQANYGYNFMNNYRFTHGPTAYLGFNRSKNFYSGGDHDILYYGLGYTFSYRTIYYELGYGLFDHTSQNKKWSNSGWVFQLGLVFRLVEKEYKEKRPQSYYY